MRLVRLVGLGARSTLVVLLVATAGACGASAVNVRNADNGAESCRSRCVKCVDAPRCPLDAAGGACALADVEAASCASGTHTGDLYQRGALHDAYFDCGAAILLAPWGDDTSGRAHVYAFDARTGALVADAIGWTGATCTDGDRAYRIESRGGAPGFLFPSDVHASCKPLHLPCSEGAEPAR